jgi:carbamoyl-phosphate synthase large subunit
VKPANWQQACIAVTGLNAADNPAPGIGVARSLRDGGHTGRLIGLAYDTLDAGVYHRDLFDEIHLLPYPSRGPEAMGNRLKAIAHDTGLQVVLPTLDSEMEPFLKLEAGLAEVGISTFLPDRAGLAMRSKSRLEEFCSREGFATPETRVLNNLGDLKAAWEELATSSDREPFYVKGVYYDARPVRSLSAAEAAFHEISAAWGMPVLLQRGMPGFEFNVCCLGDGEGNLVGSVAMRKLGLTAKGKAWSGVTVSNPELDELAASMIRALKWRGPCELEILSVENSGELLLIEINPRFPAWCYLCTGAGVNLPAAQVMLALGGDGPALSAAKSGVIYTRMAMDIVCDLEVMESLSTKGCAQYRRDDRHE